MPKILDSWKRPTEQPKVYHSGYEQQLELQLNKTQDATPEEFDNWYKEELEWWGEKQLLIVAIAAVIQLTVFGLMLTSFYLIGIMADKV